MTLLGWVYVALFGSWLILSAVNQFHGDRVSAIRRYDRLHLLPVWTFFAPNPGRSDYHILARDRGANGEIGPWVDVMPIPRQRLRSSFWNPEKRRVKVVSDAVGSIVETMVTCRKESQARESLERSLVIYGPYLLLVNIVLHVAPHEKGSRASQFAIVERFGFGAESPPMPILSSRFHNLV